jgi:hypothetical protein
MAPRAKAVKTSSVAKAAAAPASRKRKELAPDAPLMDRLDNDEMTLSRGTAALGSKIRTLEGKVSKIIVDNFPNWPSAQVDVMKKEGLTLRQRITRDKEAGSLAGSTTKMGKFYYQQLRELYEGANPCESLPVRSLDEPEDPLLKTALISFVKVSTNTSQLTEWCCMVPEVNQKNVCALFRQLLRTYPAQNMIIATLICDVMKMIVRIGLDTKYPAEVKAMTSHFDIALLKTFVNFKANNLSTQLWWEQGRAFAGLVLPTVAVDEVMACKTGWQNVAAQLQKVVSSSECGRTMFSKALRAHNTDKLEMVVKTVLQKLDGKALTEESVSAARGEFLVAWKGLGGENFLGTEKKLAVVLYRGVPVQVHAQSPLDLFSIHMEALIRSEGVALKVLNPLWCEDDLALVKGSKCTSVAESLLKQCKVARAAITDLATDLSGAGLRAILLKKQSLLLQCDRMFKVELAFWLQSLGESASERFHTAILACFPTSNKQVSMSATKKALDTLAGGSLSKLCGTGLQGVLASCAELVDVLISGNPPNFKKLGNSPFAKKLETGCSLYCVWNPGASSSGPGGPSLFGQEALQKMWDQMLKDLGTGEPTYTLLRPFRTFSWLLKADLVDKLKAMTDKAVVGQTATSSGGPLDAKKKKAAKKVKDDSAAMVAKLFE